MSIHIPEWLLWLIGVPVGVGLFAFLALGAMFAWVWFFGN